MKRLCCVLLVLVVFFSLVSCGKEEKVSVLDVVTSFDEELYYADVYDALEITEIKRKLTLEGDILEIVHIMKKKTAPPTLVWTYVYEFELEADAVAFAENRAVFMDSTDNGKCVRLGNIVVYGNSDVIGEFEK